MPVTLVDLYKSAKDNYAKKFIWDLARHKSQILSMLPIVTIDGLKITGSRALTVPSTGNRKLGAPWTASNGRREEIEETVFIYGGMISLDRIATKVQPKNGQPGELEFQTQGLRESMVYTTSDHFVTGDHGVSPDGMEGLSKRIGNGLSRYDMTLESGGVSLDVLSSKANALKFLGYLRGLKNRLGGVDLIVCNEATKNLIQDVLIFLGSERLLASTRDSFEREFDTLWGAPIVDIGYKSDMSTEIIGNTLGTDTLGSQLYFVRKGEEGLNLLQLANTGPEPIDPNAGGLNGVNVERIVDWGLGLLNQSRHSAIGRLKGFKAGAY